ncbi:MAG: flagellar biosynthesis protein FlhB [Woeseia sp.]
MAEEKPQQDRTEEPTPKRREDARKKGDVPRSRELTMTGVMLTGAGTLLFMAGPIGERIVSGFSAALVIDRRAAFDTAYMIDAFAASIEGAILGIAPLLIILIVAVFAGATLLGGWSFSLKAASFKAERMSPIKGIKRIFSANSLNELLKAMAKFGLVAAFSVFWLWWSMEELLLLGHQPIDAAILHALEISALSLLFVSCSLILIAAADIPFQLWNYRKKLRMTRTEVRDEFKETEGRPEVKARISMLQQQIASRRMMEAVPTADVVVTNPTHVAVALKYDEHRMGAPRVVAKGRGLIAARIRELAGEHDVPLFSAPPLARALVRSTEIGQEIPAALYTAVAQVLAYIFQLKTATAHGHRNPAPPEPEVDESLFDRRGGIGGR